MFDLIVPIKRSHFELSEKQKIFEIEQSKL